METLLAQTRESPMKWKYLHSTLDELPDSSRYSLGVALVLVQRLEPMPIDGA